MESFCVNCEKTGKTTILLTQIPFFKEIIIVSFFCEECGYRNNEVQSGGKLNDLGSRITLTVTRPEDLSRDVVKSEFAAIQIPELEFEVPPSKKGYLNTIEGFLNNFSEELEAHQPERKKLDHAIAAKIDEFLGKLKDYAAGKVLPFTFRIDDPSGNSHVKNPYAPKEDPMLTIQTYERTPEQLTEMGFEVENSIINVTQSVTTEKKELPNPEVKPPEEEVKKEDLLNKPEESKKEVHPQDHLVQVGAHRLDLTKPLVEDLKSESFGFPTDCHACMGKSETNMCVIEIPYFKELIIMSSTCPKCGARSTETKTGGETSKSGRIITLKAETMDDLKRDCFKSETCHVTIPEIDLELSHGTLGGRYTTIEGLLEEIEKSLKNNNPFIGDSVDNLFKSRLNEFFARLKEIRKMKKPFTLILRDPMANTFVQNPYFPGKDPRVEVADYERTFEENEFLGLNDIKTEKYQ